MEAMVLHAVGDLRLHQVNVPTPGIGQVLIRVAFCGVCGSDIPRIYTKGTYSFPTICGHEFSGVIETCGDGITHYHSGDRVVVFPLLWCGECPACEQGKYVQCSNYDYLGSRRDGAFAQYVVAPEQNLLMIPDGVSMDEAAMTEPAAVALHALRRAGGVSIGDSVAIFGLGPIGLMVAQWARAMGAARIFLFDVQPAKIDLAQKMGFADAYNSREQSPELLIQELTGKAGVNVAIEAVGLPATLLNALGSVSRCGRVVILGNPSAEVTIPASLISRLMRQEINIFGAWNSDFSTTGNRDDWRDVLISIQSRQLNLQPLISHRVALDHGCEMLASMRDGNDYYCKVLIAPGSKVMNMIDREMP